MPRRSVQSLVAFATCMAVSGAVYAESFLVNNLHDSGVDSLRAAIDSANANPGPGPHTIEFNGELNGTIVLSSDLPQLTADVEITGPGAEIITVSGQSLYRPFFVSSGSTVTLTGLTIANGHSSPLGSAGANAGGGIYNQGNLTVTDCVLTNNHAQLDGGAIINNVDGVLRVSRSTLFGNTTGGGGVGAGIYNDGGTVNIDKSTFAANAADYGGAIYNEGSVTIVDSTLTANRADAIDAFGGAIENVGSLIVRNSTLSANVANIAGAETSGGGIDNFIGEASVEFSTLTENSAAIGGGGGIANATSITLKNSLVVNSVAGGNCVNDGGTFTVLGVNFATDDSCAGFTQTTEGAINLGPLADNGGPTQTHALLGGSVAVDAALDCTLIDGATPVTPDPRGWARPAGTACDSGAFEVSVSRPETIFLDGFESN